jgi:hypothetical protein
LFIFLADRGSIAARKLVEVVNCCIKARTAVIGEVFLESIVCKTTGENILGASTLGVSGCAAYWFNRMG